MEPTLAFEIPAGKARSVGDTCLSRVSSAKYLQSDHDPLVAPDPGITTSCQVGAIDESYLLRRFDC